MATSRESRILFIRIIEKKIYFNNRTWGNHMDNELEEKNIVDHMSSMHN